MKRIAKARTLGLGSAACLAGGVVLGLATPSPATVHAAEGACGEEASCSFKKPNILLAVDWSSSMNWDFDQNSGTAAERWNAAEDAVRSIIDAQNGFFDENMHFALMRFGSDGCALGAPTVVDVEWYDTVGADKAYYECNGQTIKDALDGPIGPPPVPGVGGCATWTKSALDRAKEMIETSRADHPEDTRTGAERFYGVIVITDGAWNGPNGAGSMSDPRDPLDDPAPVAAELFNDLDVPTYVVAMSTEALALGDADDLAAAGGTMAAVDGSSAGDVEMALQTIIDDIRDSVIVPTCTEGLPRIMVILDGSSSMLNEGASEVSSQGQSGWDQALAALAGANSIFDARVNGGQNTAEDLVHLGLMVFGHNSPGSGEQKLLVQYGPCMKDNFQWALDPQTSCISPGCTDPWAGPPIEWTFQVSPPNVPPGYRQPFRQETRSHMPRCECSPNGCSTAGCTGSGTYTHLGLGLARSNIADYRANPGAFPIDDNTQFVNILITDGNYSGYSTDAQVRSALEDMYGDGVTTYVIGFGEGNINQGLLEDMADWGSGAARDAFTATDQQDLEGVLSTIVEQIALDPCCAFNDCSAVPEPLAPGEQPGTTGTDTGDPSGTGSDSEGTTSGGGTDDGTGTAGTTAATSTSGGTGTTGSGTQGSTGGAESSGGTDDPGSTSTSGGPQPTTGDSSGASASGSTGDETGDETSGGDSPAPEDDPGDEGCDCRATRSVGTSWLPLLALAGVRRRRRRAIRP